jgi:hypothetical protein
VWEVKCDNRSLDSMSTKYGESSGEQLNTREDMGWSVSKDTLKVERVR